MTAESLVIGPHHGPVNMSLLFAHTERNVPSSYQSQLVKIQPSSQKGRRELVTDTLKGLRRTPASDSARS